MFKSLIEREREHLKDYSERFIISCRIFYFMCMYLPTSIIGTLGQCALSSGCHLLATFSKELRALMEKQIKKQSVCKREELHECTCINTFEERIF